jgi:cbb3-type cytochrome c oxidase subunit III
MIDSRILIGLIAVLMTIGSIVYVGINEPDRQAEFKAAFHGRSVEAGAGIFTEYCAPCHGLHGEGTPRAPTLNSKQFFENRLKELGYQGSMRSYLLLTVSGGRPAMSTSGPWPENMPTWSVDYGGPLRNDLINNVVDYILNWEAEAPDIEAAGEAEVQGDTPEERGRNLFTTVAGCVACHAINGEGGNIAPDLGNVYANKGEDYIRESILTPNAVIAEGFQPNIMPQNFGDRLSEDQINDIIAYLKSVSGG